MTEKEKSYAGILYQSGNPELIADCDITVKKLYEENQLHTLDRKVRQVAIRNLLGKVGKNCTVEQTLFCTYGYTTTLGDHVFLNATCKLMIAEKSPLATMSLLLPMFVSFQKNTP